MQSKHLGLTTETGEKTMEHIVRNSSPTFSSNVAPKRLFPIRHVASADKPEAPAAAPQPMVQLVFPGAAGCHPHPMSCHMPSIGHRDAMISMLM